MVVQLKPESDWGIQLVGDRSEIKALETYRQLQRKHQAILGSHEPVLIRTTVAVRLHPSGIGSASMRTVARLPKRCAPD